MSSTSRSKRPPFRPFFAVVEDAASNESYNPYVTYTFSDDEPDMLLNAVLDSLDVTEPGSSSATNSSLEAKASSASGGGTGNSQASTLTPERHLIVDLGEDGKSVVAVKSLGLDWHTEKVEIAAAPTLGGDDGNDQPGLLMKILGRSNDIGNVMKSHPLHDVKGTDESREDTSLNDVLQSLAAKYHEQVQHLDTLTVSRNDVV